MPKFFVSYRRQSSEAITGRLLDRLVDHYGEASIFIDINNIAAGSDIRQRINQVLNEADIMIAVVGLKWLGSGKKGGNNLQREDDWVRLEIETALRRHAVVIPVLVDGAQMPSVSELPDSMKDFGYLNAETIASGRDFHMHVDRLIRSIDVTLSAATRTHETAAVVFPAGDDERRIAVLPASEATAENIAENNLRSNEVPRSDRSSGLFEKPALPGAVGAGPSLVEPSPVVMRRNNSRVYVALAAAAVAVSLLGYEVVRIRDGPAGEPVAKEKGQLADGQVAGKGKPAAEQVAEKGKPADPRTEAALRRLIDGIIKGKPNYDEMSPAAAEAARSQLPLLIPRLAELNTQLVTFLRTNPKGEDEYSVASKNGGPLWWRISLDSKGLILTAWFTPVS